MNLRLLLHIISIIWLLILITIIRLIRLIRVINYLLPVIAVALALPENVVIVGIVPLIGLGRQEHITCAPLMEVGRWRIWLVVAIIGVVVGMELQR